MRQRKTDLLLHVCCAPCATAVLEELLQEFSVTAFFYNPNIQPDTEYGRRLSAARALCDLKGIELIVSDPDAQVWQRHTAGLEQEPEGGSRCRVCFDLRLRAAVEAARGKGIQRVATTLSISPHKSTALVNAAGLEAAGGTGIEFLDRDFKQNDGYRTSCELSRRYGLYRQNYCGCLPSLRVKG